MLLDPEKRGQSQRKQPETATQGEYFFSGRRKVHARLKLCYRRFFIDKNAGHAGQTDYLKDFQVKL